MDEASIRQVLEDFNAGMRIIVVAEHPRDAMDDFLRTAESSLKNVQTVVRACESRTDGKVTFLAPHGLSERVRGMIVDKVHVIAPAWEHLTRDDYDALHVVLRVAGA